MKHFLIVTAFIFTSGWAFGQGFNQGVGIRGGYTAGFEYRYYFSDEFSGKALLGIRERGLQMHALTEFYEYDLFPFSYQLVFFYGFGGHFGYESWNEEQAQNGLRREVRRTSFLAGIDGLIGVEYLFYEAPLVFGLEVKPYVDLYGKDGLEFDVMPYDFAFTVKYLF